MISVIFSTYNGSRTLPIMLNSLVILNVPETGWQLIAVDNGSTDNSFDILKGFLDVLPLKVIKHPVRGKNNALNRAIEEVLGDLVVFTDDDIVATPDWLHSLIDCASNNPDFDVFGGAILPYWERTPPYWISEAVPLGVTFALTDPDLPEGEIYPGLIWGPNMMVRRRVFEAGHRFNGNIGPSIGQYIMGSETEFNIRVCNAGYQSWFCPRAKVQHIIRDFQLNDEWVVKRAFRFGRNACFQEYSEHGNRNATQWFFGKLNFPRWMARKYIENQLFGMYASLTGNKRKAIQCRWDASFQRGYIAQAQEFLRGSS